MDIEALRRYCLGFPHVTENVQWGYDLCFKVDGKLFAVTPLEPASVQLSFKCSPEIFAELCERPGVQPAPYLARAHWVALEQLNTLPDSELRDLLADAYRLVWERLPRKRREELDKRKRKERVGERGRKVPPAEAKSKGKAKRAKAGQ